MKKKKKIFNKISSKKNLSSILYKIESVLKFLLPLQSLSKFERQQKLKKELNDLKNLRKSRKFKIKRISTDAIYTKEEIKNLISTGFETKKVNLKKKTYKVI